MEPLPTPHNNFFHFALSHLPNAQSLIETQLSEAALAEFDLETLKVETGSFIDANLTEKFSDLLMSVQLSKVVSEKPENALVYFLFEHKSQTDKLTVLQLLTYIVRIWEQRLRDDLPFQCIPENQLPEWIRAIGVYVMSVNKKIDSQEYKQTLASILPVQFEPGSLADRLLIQGREEGRKEGMHRGKLTGMIQVLQELLGDAPMPDEASHECDIDALAKQLEELQQRLRARQG